MKAKKYIIGVLVCGLVIFLFAFGIMHWKNTIINNYDDSKVGGNKDFAINFLKLENNNKNVIYSPLSIKYALLMLNSGATGISKGEINKILDTGTVSKYNNVENVLSLANAAFIRNSFKDKIKKNYINTITSDYKAEVLFGDFKDANGINSWISKKTFKIINDMLDDATVNNPDTALILVNALAINMLWKDQFDQLNMNKEDFTLEDNTKIKVDMLKQVTSSEFNEYYIDENVTILKKDLKEYDNNQFEFVAIKPTVKLQEFINKSSLEKINNYIRKTKKVEDKYTKLIIKIPKFTYEYDLNLKNDLNKLGVKEIFDRKKANLKNISDEKLYVSDIKHKAKIEFSEVGIKAAATTVAISMATTAIPDHEIKYIELDFDKPFLYFIRDKKDGTIWFVGTLNNPNQN